MSTLLAKRMGARRVIALVNRASYVDLLEGNRIDIVISPYLSTIGSILAHLRRGAWWRRTRYAAAAPRCWR